MEPSVKHTQSDSHEMQEAGWQPSSHMDHQTDTHLQLQRADASRAGRYLDVLKEALDGGEAAAGAVGAGV